MQNLTAVYKGIFSTSMFKPTQKYIDKIKSQNLKAKDKNIEFEMTEEKLVFNNDNDFGDGQLNFSQAVKSICDGKLLDKDKFETLLSIAGRLNKSLTSEDDYSKRENILRNVGDVLKNYIELEDCLKYISKSLEEITLALGEQIDITYAQNIINYQIGILRTNEVFFVDLNSRLCDALKKGDDFKNKSIDYILQNPTENTKVTYIESEEGLQKVTGGRVSSVYKVGDKFFKMGQIFLQPIDKGKDSQEISMGNIKKQAYEELKAAKDQNQISEIKKRYETLVNTSFRANLAYEIANLLDFDCIAKTNVGVNTKDYVSIMDNAQGDHAVRVLNDEKFVKVSEEGKKSVKVNKDFIETILQLNIIDYILFSADRHDDNWFIDNSKEVLGKITGIDNDFINPFEKYLRNLKGYPTEGSLSFLFVKTKIPFVTQRTRDAFDKIPSSYLENILRLTLPNNPKARQQRRTL